MTNFTNESIEQILDNALELRLKDGDFKDVSRVATHEVYISMGGRTYRLHREEVRDIVKAYLDNQVENILDKL